jgi:hypothetical protein
MKLTAGIVVIVIGLALASCSDKGVSVPPEIPIEQLLAAPDTLVIDSSAIILNTYMYRDFMPISPPDGKPLIAIVDIAKPDSSNLPAGLSADAIWIINGQQIWKSWFSNEQPPADWIRPNLLKRVARKGPKWGPDIYVDTVVRVIGPNGEKYLLRAQHQYIGRTD